MIQSYTNQISSRCCTHITHCSCTNTGCFRTPNILAAHGPPRRHGPALILKEPIISISAETPTDLLFGDKSIAIITFEDGGVPYFSLLDLQEALGWPTSANDLVDTPLFPPHCKRTALEYGPEGVTDAVVLSPTGVLYWTSLFNAGKGQRITAWAKREARMFCPNARPDDPAMFLQVTGDRQLPPPPLAYSGWRGEWNDLRNSDAYLKRPSVMSAVRAAQAAKRDAAIATGQ